ncbi:MAG: sulfotransferase [Thermodesulfobacteriota bacterium]
MIEVLKRVKINLSQEYYRFRSYIGRPRLVVQKQPVILSDADLCENPIFIIGVHRAGTSLVRRIVDSHSRIACPPETFFLQYFATMIRDETNLAGLEGLGINRESSSFEIRKWASRYHEAYRIMRGKDRWADKTPQYISILPELEQIFGPRVQYIMVFRHPLDVIHSIIKRGWKFGDYHSDLLMNTAMYVSDSIRKQVSFANNYPDRCFYLYYENLILNPEKNLQAMFKFLGERWESGVLNYNNFEHGFGTEDPVVRGTKGFMTNFGNWKAFNQKQLSAIIPIV